MAIEIKRPVFLCGENPGMTLYKSDAEQILAIVSYWHVTYSPHGTGNALVMWLDESIPFPAGIFTDNIPLAQILVNTLIQHFPEFKNFPISKLPYHSSHCEHIFKNDRYLASCSSGKNKITVEWSEMLDQKSLSWVNFPIGDQNFDLNTVICPCNSGTLSINEINVMGKVKTGLSSDNMPSSSAFLAFAESWVGPNP